MDAIKKWLNIFIGCILMSIALNSLLEPFAIVIGGATGIGVILKSLVGVSMSITNLIVNIPLIIIAFRLLGFKFIKDTLYTTLLFSATLEITSYLPAVESDIVIAAIFGGVLSGIGLGLIFREGATTGGGDILAMLIHKYKPHMSISRIILITDVIIIGLGAFTLGITPTMYAILTVYILTKCIDTVLTGLDYAKAVFIISNKSNDIGNEITTKIRRGATYINCRGIYTNEERGMLLVVVSNREIAQLKEYVNNIDPNAFVIVNEVKEVQGDFQYKR